MSEEAGPRGGTDVLRSKRDATQYQILADIADRQPAVNQREIASAVGITAQAVSEYLQSLVDEGYVEKHGRGRYEVTKTGVDWLISQTDELQSFIDHVSKDVIERVDVDTAIAAAAIESGDSVSLQMRDGALHAVPGAAGSTTGVAVTAGAAGSDIGVTEFDGVLNYDLGHVTIVSIPRVQDGGSNAVDSETLLKQQDKHDLTAVAGNEALAAAHTAGVEPDIRFGTTQAITEATVKGLDVLSLAVQTAVSDQTDTLRERNITYELVDPTRPDPAEGASHR